MKTAPEQMYKKKKKKRIASDECLLILAQLHVRDCGLE